MIFILASLLGLFSAGSDIHLLPQKINKPVLFGVLRIIFFILSGLVMGIIGFYIKITGLVGGLGNIVMGIVFLIFSLSYIPLLPKIIIIGLRNHHHSTNTLSSAISSVFSSSFSLHLVLALALNNGYYLDSAYIMGLFALFSSNAIFKLKFPINKIFKSLQIILLIYSSLFIVTRGLLYASIYHFSPFESLKIARVPEVLAGKQFFKTNLNHIEDRLLIGNMELIWLLEGKGNSVYIPEFKHKSTLTDDIDQLELPPINKKFIYFTLAHGKGDYILKIHPNVTDYFNLPYTRVIDSGYGEHFRVDNPIVNPSLEVSSMALSVVEGNEQKVEVIIDAKGFYPSVIVLKNDIPAIINFKLTQLTENNQRAIIPSFNTQIEFKLGDNPIRISEPRIDFMFYSFFGDFGGFVIITDDLEDFSLETAQRRVRMLNMEGL
jgi:hypothetical protein